jgi:16S rRNA (uracil1498-N3)-methyltransferase
MRLHRFYINKKINNSSQITIDDRRLIHQWRNVFRMKTGDRVVLFDGGGKDCVSDIVSLGKDEVTVKIVEKREGVIPDKEVWLFFSLIKKDNMELILQKCAELGVSHFVPVISERSEKKGLNISRAEKILTEASEQCGRSDVPKLHEIITLEDAVKKYKNELNFVAFDSSGPMLNVTSYKLQITGLFVGPEGGFTEEELALFERNNTPIYSLGALTLRAETAAIIAASTILI